jgi:hypothetical protein
VKKAAVTWRRKRIRFDALLWLIAALLHIPTFTDVKKLR